MAKELTAALIIKDGRLLMLRSTKHAAVRVEPPGGKRHAGESREQAVIREVAEETGLEVSLLVYFGAYPTESPEGSFVVHMYCCGKVKGEARLLEPGKFSSLGWHGLKELRYLKEDGTLAPNMSAALDDLRGILSED